MLLTYQDTVDHLLDYLGSDPSDAALRDAKKAVQEAYRDLANAHSWLYLYTPALINTSPFIGMDTEGNSDGSTVTYLQSSGEYPRQVTIASGTWPSWAADGFLILSGNLGYRVDKLISPNILTLDELTNPGVDIATPSAYSLYRDTYSLPSDFVAQDVTFIPQNFSNLQHVHPREWLRVVANEVRTGRPAYYSVAGSTRFPGKHVLRVAPMPDVSYAINFAYKRRPKPMFTYAEAGLASITDSSLTQVTLSAGSVFRPQDAGAVMRFSSNSADLPTEESRSNPAYHEAVVESVLDDTHALIFPAAPTSLSAVKYVISDLVDIDPGSMATALLRLSERKLSTIRIMKDREFPLEEYLRALDSAKCANSTTMMGRSPREYLFNRSMDLSLWRNR